MSTSQLNKTILAFTICAGIYFLFMLFCNLFEITGTVAYSVVLELLTLPSLGLTGIVFFYWIISSIKTKNFSNYKYIAIANLLGIVVFAVIVAMF